MTTGQRHILTTMAIGLAGTLCGCGSDTRMQHTNATTTEELNQISDNTAENAGQGEAQDMSDPTTGGGVATKPRKY